METRTRFAPSPTGYMHIGNLRTALYGYLFAHHEHGKFILRIEDTDQNRLVEGATEVIYQTLKQTHLSHDEGPDIGGKYGPYVQSERKELYKKYAEMLVESGHAYYCFCSKDEEEKEREKENEEQGFSSGYNRHCRNLSKEEIEENLRAGKPYVIRQKIPLDGTTTFHDEVFGDVTVENSTLDDQVLLKSDGMPTYNFANVIDDHLMEISHVMRGREYIASTPKYQLLYEAFGWEPPKTAHLSTIMGKNADGSISKLSKRHGSVSFAKLVEEKGCFVNLYGEIGAGKTAFVKEVAKEIGIEEKVTSPTFVILNEYHGGKLPMYHFDLYRLENEGVKTIMDELREYSEGKQLTFVEWAEFSQNEFPFNHIKINVTYEDNDDRKYTFTGYGKDCIVIIKGLEK